MSKLSSILKWVDLSRVILGPILAAKGVSPTLITGIVTTVGDAETALGPGTGAQKLGAVIDGLQNTMQASGASQETIQATTEAVTDGLTQGIQVIKDVQAVQAAHAAGSPSPLPGPTPPPIPPVPVPPTAS